MSRHRLQDDPGLSIQSRSRAGTSVRPGQIRHPGMGSAGAVEALRPHRVSLRSDRTDHGGSRALDRGAGACADWPDIPLHLSRQGRAPEAPTTPPCRQRDLCAVAPATDPDRDWRGRSRVRFLPRPRRSGSCFTAGPQRRRLPRAAEISLPAAGPSRRVISATAPARRSSFLPGPMGLRRGFGALARGCGSPPAPPPRGSALAAPVGGRRPGQCWRSASGRGLAAPSAGARGSGRPGPAGGRCRARRRCDQVGFTGNRLVNPGNSH